MPHPAAGSAPKRMLPQTICSSNQHPRCACPKISCSGTLQRHQCPGPNPHITPSQEQWHPGSKTLLQWHHPNLLIEHQQQCCWVSRAWSRRKSAHPPAHCESICILQCRYKFYTRLDSNEMVEATAATYILKHLRVYTCISIYIYMYIL